MSIIRLVGAPATGKSYVAARLETELAIPSFGIDQERLRYGWGDRAWVSLREKVAAARKCIVETSGHSRNDRVLCLGHPTLTILCTASRSIRAKRLRERVEVGYYLAAGQDDYVERLMKLGSPALKPHLVVNTDHDIGLDIWQRMLDHCRSLK